MKPVIPLARPDLGPDAAAAVADVLASGWLVQGPAVAAFEGLVAQRCAVPHGVACSSGTAALHLALEALQLPRGSKVVVPGYTFPATINVVLLSGLVPVIADVDPATFNVDVDSALRAFDGDDGSTDGSTAAVLLAVHQFGLPAPLEVLGPACVERGMVVIEDAACALGASLEIEGRPRPAGSLGAMGCFSFHPRKIVTTGEGGMVTTGDAELDERLRRLRNHGMQAGPDGLLFVEAGFNYRLTEMQGALGVSQMARLDDLLADRQRIAAGYLARLPALERLGVLPPVVPAGATPTWQTFQCRIPATADLDQVIGSMRAEGVEVNFGAHALHQHPAYSEALRASTGLRGATEARARGLALPVPGGLTDREMDRVIDTLAAVVR